jgi:hypothetical protein
MKWFWDPYTTAPAQHADGLPASLVIFDEACMLCDEAFLGWRPVRWQAAIGAPARGVSGGSR